MRLLTAQETSALLRVSCQRVYEMARQGLLPAVRVGRCVRFDEVRLRSWLDAGGYALDEPQEGTRR
jgi:excisionase family DNA binding protein